MFKVVKLLLSLKISFKKIDFKNDILLLDIIFLDILEKIYNKKINVLKIRYEELNFYALLRLFFSQKKKIFLIM